eukprot:jgi/Botrbrau1/11663/Bobra.168_2s0018.1
MEPGLHSVQQRSGRQPQVLPAQHVDHGNGHGARHQRASEQGLQLRHRHLLEYLRCHSEGHRGASLHRQGGADDADGRDMAYRVVADHIRTLSFAIADGARPGNEGREYVLRRVLRRAVRYGREVLGGPEGFFASLVDSVAAAMGSFYPEIPARRDHIYEVLREEEASFSRTLEKGIERFKKAAASIPKGGSLPGKDAFELWDTFGFPLDLTELMAEERGLTVDKEGFEAAMSAQKERSRAAGKKAGGATIKFEAEATAHLQRTGVPLTDDLPKYGEQDVETEVLAILSPTGFVTSSAEDGEGPLGLILRSTSFYAESGGQVADTGSLQSSSALFNVQDTQVAAGYVLHVGYPTKGEIKVGDKISSKVDYSRRGKIVPNHTFTHVLNMALRDVLGEHVDQKGSIVQPERLRFDFSHNGSIETLSLARIESICQAAVEQALPVYSKEVSLAQARQINGLRAVFGEVYPDPVRVVSVGVPVEQLLSDPAAPTNRNYSIEFCGGTHLKNTKDAKAFALVSEEGIAKGVRRIVAVTAGDALKAIALAEELKAKVEAARKLPPSELEQATASLKVAVDAAAIPAVAKANLREEISAFGRILAQEAKKAAAANKAQSITTALDAANKAVGSGKAYCLVELKVGLDPKAAQEAWAAVQAAHPSLPLIIFTADAEKGKALVYAGVPTDVSKKLPAGEWVKAALDLLGGKGGGKPTSAQGQGPLLEKLPDAIKAATAFADSRL